jgi:hypothetical protein
MICSLPADLDRFLPEDNRELASLLSEGQSRVPSCPPSLAVGAC